MSEIRRYVAIETDIASRAVVGDKEYAGCVDVVTYTDHVAAVALREEELNAEWAAAMDAAVTAARIKDDEYQKDMLAENDAGYAQGQRDAFGGLSEEEYQRRIIVKNFDAGVKAARDAVVALPNRYTMEPGHMTLIFAAIDGVKP